MMTSVTDRRADTRPAGTVRKWTMGISVTAAVLGAWSFFAPASFHADFPVAGAEWVSTLGMYNEHLMRDYGAAQIGLGIAGILAATSASTAAVRGVLAGFTASGALHLGYHLGTFDQFDTGSAVTQGVALAALVVVPATLLTVQRRSTTGGER